ncbi:putative ankyrin repeat protein [Aerococcus phage vB_AviM_AVP]|nr:putative ankyrin repeat protein [Aerococcus phage vB_AviM_AVP]
MKDYKRYTNLENTTSLLQQFSELDCDIFTIEGGLNDTHLIITEPLQDTHKMGRIKLRKYMILGYEHASEYHNHLYMQLTDNDKLYEELYQEYEEQEEALYIGY